AEEYRFRVRGVLGRYSRGYAHGHQLLGGLGGPYPRRVKEDLYLMGLGHHSHVSDSF
ncbi:hypothetical protein A2U01_0113419, partial [Trifolium medium]|nr:hypothetical protein [Trifolium medium]